MAEWPPIVALIITYRRLPLAKATIQGVKENIKYPGQIGFHIADDGSGQGYVDALRAEIGDDYHVTVTDAARGGVGKNMNLGIKACLERADIWLHLEDDWVLDHPFDLSPAVDTLRSHAEIGMVRLGYLNLGLSGSIYSAGNKLWWRLERAGSYVVSGHAALRHRRFWKAYGPYKTGLTPGQTELDYVERFKSGKGPDVLWPAYTPDGIFKHMGDHQSYKVLMEREGLSGEEAAAKFEEMDKAAAMSKELE